MWRALRRQSASQLLYSALSEIDAKARHGTIEEVLAVLDANKPALFDCLRSHFQSAVAAQAVALKLLNLSLAKHHFLTRSAELLSRPPGLVVDPSNACNLACPGCVHSENAKELKLFDWKPGIVPEKRMAAFFRHYGPSAIHVILCNYGEPLVHPDTPKFIRLAKTYLLHTMISTNLSLPRFDAGAYVESGLDYMVLSIDGASQPVYQQFRRKGDIELVFRNIEKLVEARNRGGKRTPIIAWRYLAFEHNVHEIPAAVETARRLGVDQFKAVPAWDISWDDPKIQPARMEPLTVDFTKDCYDALVENWNPFPDCLDHDAIQRDFEDSWAAKAPARNGSNPARAGGSCEWLYKSMTMDAGGRVLPCCCAPTSKKDLHFAQFDEDLPGAAFNSRKHRMARLSFADPVAYRARRDAGVLEQDPYCLRCEWDKTADPDDSQIKQYFQSAGQALFESRTLDLLSW